MTAEIVTYQHTTTLTEQMDYARTVSSASMLPDNYRGKPADIMLAVGLGQAMGLSPAESLYRISVIKGKPTASAELIAANVRKAGHKLRVSIDEANTSVNATVLRSDDPEFPFSVTRDMNWAKQMGLAGNDNYKKQALTMLQWRAITAVARLACPEALYGVAHTPDEVEYADDAPTGPPPQSGRERFAQAIGVEQVPSEPEPEAPAESPLLNTSSSLAKAMYAAIHEAGVPEDERIDWLSNVIDRDITSSKEMTEDEARTVLDHINAQAPA